MEMQMEILPVIVVDHFSAERTWRFAEELRQYSGDDPVRFFIVDNSEDQENLEKLRQYFKAVERTGYPSFPVYADQEGLAYIIDAGENKGFAAGNDLGFLVARSFCTFHHVIFSNNDLRFDSRFCLKRLLDVFSMDKRIGIVGPRVEGTDHEPQSPCREMSLYDRWWRLFLCWPWGKLLGEKGERILKRTDDRIEVCGTQAVYRVIGAFMAVDAERFAHVGMFDENTFLYAEEMILSEKMRREGFLTYYTDRTAVLHEGGHTTEKVMPSEGRLERRFLSELYYYQAYKQVDAVTIKLTRWLFRWYSFKRRLVRGAKNMGAEKRQA